MGGEDEPDPGEVEEGLKFGVRKVDLVVIEAHVYYER